MIYQSLKSDSVRSGLARVVASPVVRTASLLALCAAYIQGSLTKIFDFNGALAEMEHFGLQPAAFFAIAVIAFELTASALVISGFLRWAGSLALAGFTLLATFIALRFWEMAGPGSHDGGQRLLRTSRPRWRIPLRRRIRLIQGSRQMSTAKPSGGTFAFLKQPVFAVFWIATALDNTRNFVRDVASSWLMTDLSASPAARPGGQGLPEQG